MKHENAFDFGPALDFERSRLGTFRVVDRLASGGMAAVYLGCRRSARGAMELAAVKVMLPELNYDPDYKEMFLDEIRLTSAVRHPGVARMLEHGVDDSLHYLTTEYLFGETWSDVVSAIQKSESARPIASRLFVSILIQVCDALHAVHETSDDAGRPLSIVHRDVSPTNLMVCYDGSVKVVDFGIATACQRLHETRDGLLKGHVAYMAPEQARGLKVDRRCDVWPLGVMLWEGLTGRRLFKRDNSRSTILAVATDPLEASLASDELGPSLRPVVAQALERDLSRRFQTAAQMGDALRAASRPGDLLTPEEIASWMQRVFADRFAQRRKELKQKVARILGESTDPAGSARSAVMRIDALRKQALARRAFGGGMKGTSLYALHTVRSAARTMMERLTRAPRSFHLTAVLLLFVLGWICGGGSQPTEKPQANLPSVPPSSLSIRAQGHAVLVELSGKSLGKTPLSLAVPAGRHLVRVHPSDGGEPVVKEIELASGQRYELLVEPTGPN